MFPSPPTSSRTGPPFPSTTLCRSLRLARVPAADRARRAIVAIDADIIGVEAVGVAVRSGAAGDLRRHEREIERLVRHIGQLEGRDGIGLSGHDGRREIRDLDRKSVW